MYFILSIDFKLLLDVKNGVKLIFFHRCDALRRCDAMRRSKRKYFQDQEASTEKSLCFSVAQRRTASHRRIASHLRKIFYSNCYLIYKSFS